MNEGLAGLEWQEGKFNFWVSNPFKNVPNYGFFSYKHSF